MELSPAISIVLPTFNGSRFLDQAIQSCHDQTFQNWELVIVDDASTDNTSQIIHQWQLQDRRIRSFRHETNRRLPAALNTGFNQARGAFLSWTSDDNCFRPTALEMLMAFLNDRTDVDFVYADYSQFDEEGRVSERISNPSSENLIYCNCIGPCFLYRREVYNRIGNFAEDCFLAEDYEYWLRIATRFHLAALNEDLYLYRNHSNSLTAQHQQRAYWIGRQALSRYLSRLPWVSASTRARIYRVLAHEALKNHQPALALRLLLRCLFNLPELLFTVFWGR